MSHEPDTLISLAMTVKMHNFLFRSTLRGGMSCRGHYPPLSGAIITHHTSSRRLPPSKSNPSTPVRFLNLKNNNNNQLPINALFAATSLLLYTSRGTAATAAGGPAGCVAVAAVLCECLLKEGQRTSGVGPNK